MRRPSQSICPEGEQSYKKCQIGRSINIMTLFKIDNKISLVLYVVWMRYRVEKTVNGRHVFDIMVFCKPLFKTLVEIKVKELALLNVIILSLFCL